MVDGSHNPDILIPGYAYVGIERSGASSFREIVIRRLENSEKQEPDAYARREHHRYPAGIGVVRFGVFASDPDRTDGQENE